MPSATALAHMVCPRCGGTFESKAVFCPRDGERLEPGDASSLGPDEDAPPSDSYIGAVLSGDIEIQSVAGAGAMGRVYRARQLEIDRDVAVKILHRELSGNAQLVSRFHREAKIASKLQHPHVVEVYLAGQLPDGSLYIVMEFLDGMSLAAALAEQGGPLPVDRALSIALQICAAVGEGHSLGIVHRDLKPENVMLITRAEITDWVKVLDFGIAKVSLGDQSMETAAGLIFGTAKYISPEGAQGATVGPQGDVYSLAVMVYQMLSGRTPFQADQPVGHLVKHIHEAPPPLRSLPSAADVPEPIANVVMENLAKDAADRAPNARAFGVALATAARQANVGFPDVGVVSRMSLADASSASRIAFDPTFDDAAGQLASSPPRATSSSAPSKPSSSEAPAPAVSVLGAPPSDLAPAPPRARRSPLVVVLAFLLGAALAALVTMQLSNRRDEEYDAQIARARRALAEGRLVEPPGDNVRDLVRSGLERWPDDIRFEKVQSDAAHELVTRAMAARSTGDVMGARDLANEAADIDMNDRTARLLAQQYEEELRSALSDAGAALGAPRLLLDVPVGRAHPQANAELVARVLLGSARPGSVHGPRFVVFGPGLPTRGVEIQAMGDGPFRTLFKPPEKGRYTVVFEVSADGSPLRAERALRVTPAR